MIEKHSGTVQAFAAQLSRTCLNDAMLRAETGNGSDLHASGESGIERQGERRNSNVPNRTRFDQGTGSPIAYYGSLDCTEVVCAAVVS